MLRVILALVGIAIVATSLASRLSDVRAASIKNKTQSGKYEDITINAGAGMSKNVTRGTASGKHIPKGKLTIRKAGKGQQE
jgi:hypothetical protein